MSACKLQGRSAAGVLAAAAWLSLATTVCGAGAAPAVQAEQAVVCVAASCTVASSAAYPGLVIGSVERVLTPEESADLFRRARAAGAWPALPAGTTQFARLVRGVALRTLAGPGGQASGLSFIALMTEDEFRDTGLEPGTFVRYAPHGPEYDAPPAIRPELLPYWGVTGCVMALCRRADAACEARYLPGIYERTTGVALDWRSAKPASAVPLINPNDPSSWRAVNPATCLSSVG